MINKFKQMNYKQKKELKQRLRWLGSQIWFQAIVAVPMFYLVLLIWEQI